VSFELPLQIILLRILGLLLIGMVHALSLAAIVSMEGDRGPKFEGRLLPNPLVHAAPLGMVAAIFTMGGWIRPLDLDLGQLRHGRAGLVGAVLISLIVPIVVFVALLQLRGLVVGNLQPSYSNTINLALRTFAEMSVVFGAMNLIPLPPFAGGYLLQAASPQLFDAIKPRTAIIALVLVVLAIADRGTTVRMLLDPLIRAITGT